MIDQPQLPTKLVDPSAAARTAARRSATASRSPPSRSSLCARPRRAVLDLRPGVEMRGRACRFPGRHAVRGRVHAERCSAATIDVPWRSSDWCAGSVRHPGAGPRSSAGSWRPSRPARQPLDGRPRPCRRSRSSRRASSSEDHAAGVGVGSGTARVPGSRDGLTLELAVHGGRCQVSHGGVADVEVDLDDRSCRA